LSQEFNATDEKIKSFVLSSSPPSRFARQQAGKKEGGLGKEIYVRLHGLRPDFFRRTGYKPKRLSGGFS